MNFPLLFKPGQVGRMEVRNRIIGSPMERNYCTVEGRVTQRYIDFLEARARGVTPNYRIADLTNPNLTPPVKQTMQKDIDEVLAGKTAYSPSTSCEPAGVPAFLLQPSVLYFIQGPKEVVMIQSYDSQVRHVFLDVPHSAGLKPSWYGESVGHYEGDTLVVDTIGLNDRTFVDSYRTPHTDKLHVVERFRLIDNGNTLEVAFTVDDPGAFYKPWSGTRNRHKATNPNIRIAEPDCSEANDDYFNIGLEPVPTAPKPPF